MVTLHTFDGGTVNAINDALLYDFIIGKNGIVTGATVTSASALLLHIDSGWGVIKGRIFSIEDETISATPSTSGSVKGRLILQIDITNTTNPITFVTQAAATLPALQQEDINKNGTIYQLPIATYDINEVAISNLQMAAPIIDAVKKADLAINDENGNNIFETYATKEALNKKSDLKTLVFSQLDKAANLKFSGEVNTRRLAALLYIFGQSGPIEPITIGFGGIDGAALAQNLDTVISSNTYGITAGSTGTVHIPQAINYGYGNYTILLIQSNLNVEIEYM
nr:MAG TPA: Receptor Binding Protein sandwich domain, phage receptor [Caudoviricetes sp.]